MTDPNDLIKQATTICEAATPGPWDIIDDYDGVAASHGWRGMSCPSGSGGHGGDGLVFATHEWDVGLREGDIEFIATARTLVPELAAALGMAHSRIAQLASEAGAYANSLGAVSKGNQPMEIMEAIERVTRECDEARHEVADLKSQRTLFQNEAIESLHLKVNSLERDAVHHRREHQMVTEEHGKLKRERDEARAELAKLRLVSDELISARRELAELRRVHLGESSQPVNDVSPSASTRVLGCTT